MSGARRPAPPASLEPRPSSASSSGTGLSIREALSITLGIGQSKQRVGRRMKTEGFVPDLPVLLVPGFCSSVLRIEKSAVVPNWEGRRAWLSLRRLGYRAANASSLNGGSSAGTGQGNSPTSAATDDLPDDPSDVSETASLDSEASSRADLTLGHGPSTRRSSLLVEPPLMRSPAFP